MTTIIENPDPVMVKKWGPLAYVSDSERKSILNAGFGQFKPRVKMIEKQLKEMEKRKKKLEAEKKKLPRMDEKTTKGSE